MLQMVINTRGDKMAGVLGFKSLLLIKAICSDVQGLVKNL